MKNEYIPKPQSLKTALAHKLRANNYSDTNKPAVPVKLVGKEEDHPRLISLINRLAKSPFGKETLEIGAKDGYTLSFVHVAGAGGECTKEGKFITLSPHLKDDELVSVLCHEFRHAGQFARGGDELFGVENVKSELIKCRSMEADAQAASMMAAWELKDLGDANAFHAFARTNPEIYEPFKKALQEDPQAFENGKAQTAAFLGWYDNNYIKAAYEKGYQVTSMKKFITEGKDKDMPYSKNITSKEIIDSVCWSSKGNFFTGDKNVLGEGKFIDVTEKNKDFFKYYFEQRKEKYGIPVDPTVASLPTRKDSVFFSFFGSQNGLGASSITNKKISKRQNNAFMQKTMDKLRAR